jgi:23S rRNA pseudouridine1911/1915/1917 synthase
MSNMIVHSARVTTDLSLKRLDHIAAALFPQYSRSRLQQWIESGELTVNGETKKPKQKISAGSELRISAEPDVSNSEPEDIPLEIIHEDNAVLVLNKPADFVVHPGAGNQTGTVLNALLHHCPALAAVPRAGIVHRLDKNTTGLMVVAKNLTSQNLLVKQLQSREVKRIYETVTYGSVRGSGTIEANIGRHPDKRTRMSIQAKGKEAITHFRLIRSFQHHSHVELSLETGRTHQIRVHMKHIGHPLVGDPTYGGTFRTPPRNSDQSLVQCIRDFPRQALHAKSLSFVHPEKNELVSFDAPTPGDMQLLLDLLAGNETNE